MTKKSVGHDQQQPQDIDQDAFELDDDKFDELMAGAVSGDVDEGPSTDSDGDDSGDTGRESRQGDTGDTGRGQEKKPAGGDTGRGKPGDPTGDTGRDGEAPKFKLSSEKEKAADTEEKAAAEEKTASPRTLKIVHKGQVHEVTEEEAVRLAQKGFDYDRKVGPHQRIISMIEADPEAQRVLNDYFRGKVEGDNRRSALEKLKPISEFEDEREWLLANREILFPGDAQKAQQRPQGAADDPVATMAYDSLARREPDGQAVLTRVIQAFPQYVGGLTPQQLQEVNTNVFALGEFYDFVRDQVMGPPAPVPEKKTAAGEKDGVAFRAGSSHQGADERPEEAADYYWDMPNKDFDKALDKLKGLA